MKKLTLGSLALAAALAITPVALADEIGFQTNGLTDLITATVNGSLISTSLSLSGVSQGGQTITVSSMDHPADDFFLSGATITIGPIAGGGGLSIDFGGSFIATYNGGPGTVTVTDAACGGVCLMGTLNSGTYSATSGGPGSFSGNFTTTYVAPNITTELGDLNTILNTAAKDTIGTSNNSVPGTTDTGTAYTAAIQNVNVQDTIPEPSSLLLLGTGLLGLAFVAFRKAKPAGLTLNS